MKTAENFLSEKLEEVGAANFSSIVVEQIMIEFAKYHVEEAISEIQLELQFRDEYFDTNIVSEAYPIENIK